MALEKEIKFALPGFSEVRARLESIGAAFLHRQLESNEIWDVPSLQLKESHCLLRLRTEEFVSGEKRFILTFKSKPMPCTNNSNPDNAGTDGNGMTAMPACKIRHEEETGIQDPEAMRRILKGLGYAPVALYQKLREEWSLKVTDGGSESTQAIFCLDYLPFGHFLEIEAHDPVKFARLLQLDPSKSLIDSYHKINRDRKNRNATDVSPNFIFDETVWRQMRQALDIPLP